MNARQYRKLVRSLYGRTVECRGFTGIARKPLTGNRTHSIVIDGKGRSRRVEATECTLVGGAL